VTYLTQWSQVLEDSSPKAGKVHRRSDDNQLHADAKVVKRSHKSVLWKKPLNPEVKARQAEEERLHTAERQ
jgi:hypothetical protein